MKKIDAFINQYSLSKTLRFKLIPIGKTEENFYLKNLLEQDVRRADLYKKVKGYLDEYHRYFIDKAIELSDGINVCTYADLYYRPNKSTKEKEELKKEAENLRKAISSIFKNHPDYKRLLKKEVITELLPSFLKDDEAQKTVAEFFSFTTYFNGFNKNRENMYTDEEKSTSVAYRCINDNLPKYLDNVKSFLLVWEALSDEDKTKLCLDFADLIGYSVETAFSVEKYDSVISQRGITLYNNLISGYTLEDGTKIQGLNEYVNLYNQRVEKKSRLPFLKMLYKQILSDRETVSFIPEKFEKGNDNAVLKAVKDYWELIESSLDELKKLFDELADGNGVYVKNGVAISDLSQHLAGGWSVVKSAWESEYDASFTKKRNDKYEDEREKAWKNISSFSLSQLQCYVGENSVVEYYRSAVLDEIEAVRKFYGEAEVLLSSDYSKSPKSLANNDEDIALIKNFLDSVKKLEHLLLSLLGDGTEEDKNEVFYGIFNQHVGVITSIDRLYDKVRNYITQKPYSTDKVKLNFENPQLLGGWDKNKERDYRTVLLKRGGEYYLAIMDKSYSKIFVDYPYENSNGWQKIEYKLLPGPNKMLPKVFFAKSNIEYFAPSEEIMGIYKKETFKKGKNFSQDDCHKLIEFYQNSISRHSDWSQYGFVFKKPCEYSDISEFYKDVELQGYSVKYVPISEEYINRKIDNGELYLFKIYSKDFSPFSKGTPNLHTLYFKMLFDERNLRDVVYKLNGEAEMFYRFPSIKPEEMIVHPKGQPIDNKNSHNEKKTSVFEYDLIKDKRFTVPQFSLHLPITLNFKAPGNEWLNEPVRYALKKNEHNYVIGIDRGERHLIYVTVIDEDGKIVEQFSGNLVKNEYNDNEHTVDYHALLDTKEEERLKARQNWGTVENIKNLKEGYVSQIVHKICELVLKYDAIIAMEDLNSGFKNSRVKVEKQVYQKFEKMLIDKLNYLVSKTSDAESAGGLLKAYQLTEKFTSFSKMGLQNGFIFYVPAWLTSKIDPTTGFVDLLKPKYTNETETKRFVEKFKSICYNSSEEYFELSFDYKDFPKGSTDSVGKWTICTFGDRVYTHRSENANGKYVDEKLDLTQIWKEFFEDYDIDWKNGDLREIILSQNGKQFFSRFMLLLRLTLQMRNSVSNSDDDYILSPVKNANDEFYDSRICKDGMPENADANGAYNIARKALWAIGVFKNTPDEKLAKVKFSITNKEWLAFVQNK